MLINWINGIFLPIIVSIGMFQWIIHLSAKWAILNLRIQLISLTCESLVSSKGQISKFSCVLEVESSRFISCMLVIDRLIRSSNYWWKIVNHVTKLTHQNYLSAHQNITVHSKVACIIFVSTFFVSYQNLFIFGFINKCLFI